MKTRFQVCASLFGILVCLSLLTGCPEKPIAVTILPDAATLETGQTISLVAESTDERDATFTWTSSNPAIVVLNSAHGVTITITAISTGSVTITAVGSNSEAEGETIISVPVQPGEGEGEGEGESEGEGEGEGEPVDIPGGKLAPGLNVTISKVVIPADLKPEVTLTALDNKGNFIGVSELSDIRVILDYLTDVGNGGANRYFSYTTATEDPDKTPNSGDEAIQATYDSARLKGLTQNSDGSMLYKFAKAIPASYDKTLTHELGIQVARTYAVDGESYPANAIFTFRPDGEAVSETRDIVDTATCNACHTRLGLHGGGRREIQLCILCHNQQSFDANTGNSVDMPVLIHKIHAGANLPSVQAGGVYQIIGYGNSVNDYSSVVFPQDIRNCTACHVADSKAAQADVYLDTPTRAGCGACHDRIWFGDPSATPTGYENHPLNFAQTDDSKCSTCHNPSGEGVAPIMEAHLTPTQRPEAPGLAVAITNIATNATDGTLAVTFTAKFGDGTPITAITTDATLQRLGFLVAWPTTDYQESIAESVRGRSAMTGTLDSITSDTGTYTYTFSNKLPTGTSDTFAIAVTGRVTFSYVFGEEETATAEQGVESNALTFFTTDGSTPVARRSVVDDALCNKCHGDLRAHGEQRVGVGECVMCHRTNESTGGEDSVTINFKEMFHATHMGEELANEFAIGEFVANEFRFPGIVKKCSICHVTGKESVPLPTGVAPTVVMNDETLVAQVEPTRAACTSCHNGTLPNIHAILATGPAPDNLETCAICHGTGAEFAVASVHDIGN